MCMCVCYTNPQRTITNENIWKDSAWEIAWLKHKIRQLFIPYCLPSASVNQAALLLNTFHSALLAKPSNRYTVFSMNFSFHKFILTVFKATLLVAITTLITPEFQGNILC